MQSSRNLRAGAVGHAAPWVVLVAGIVLSAFAWKWTQSQVEGRGRASFEEATLDMRSTIQSRLTSYIDVLYGLQGLFHASPDVSRASFHRYATSLGLPHRYPQVRNVTFSPVVTRASKLEFERAVRLDASVDPGGNPDFAIRPPGDRPLYVPLTYIEPLQQNRTAFGFDLASEPGRRLVMERARDTGRVVASERILLQSDPGQGAGVVLRLAVYRPGALIDSVDDRRRAFTGIVGITVRIRDVVEDILANNLSGDIGLRMIDLGGWDASAIAGGKAAEDPLFESPGRAGAGRTFRDTRSLDFGGRQWELTFTAPRERFATSGEMLPLVTLAAGVLLSLLLSGFIYSLSSAGRRAIRIAEHITRDLRESEARLAEAQRRTQEMIEVLPNPIFFKDTDGRYLGVNKAWEAFFGISREAFLGKTVHELYPHDRETAQRLHATDQELWRNPGTQSYEATLTRPDGSVRDTVYYKATYADAEAKVAGLIGTIIDVTDRKQTERLQAMEIAVTRAIDESKTLAESIPRVLQKFCDAMDWQYGACWELDTATNRLNCLGAWSAHGDELQEFVAANENRPMALEPLGEGLLRRAYGTREPVWIEDVSREAGFRRRALAERAGLHTALAFPLMSGNEVIGVMEVFNRATLHPDPMLIRAVRTIGSQMGQYLVRTHAEEALKFVASHDGLTNLPNRTIFIERLVHAIGQAQRHGRRLSVLFVDLDRFKVINDTLGHDLGDELLCEMAARMTATVRGTDTVARLGGDEFVVLVEEIASPAMARRIARKLLGALGKGATIASRELSITASIGVSTYPEDGEDAQTLLKNADIAMYRAKDLGRNTFQFYSAELNVHTIEHLTLESNLRRALERNELLLHYQPQYNVTTGALTGFEALVRWQHPERGMVPPADFIPMAEETGLIVPIGEWVLTTACATLRAWEEGGMADVRMSVNLSARQLMKGELLKDVARILRQTRCTVKNLDLEITESMVMHSPDLAAAFLRSLKEMGAQVTMDDFGTGYSSLAYLQRLPIDRLKIDRSFVAEIPRHAGSMAITRAVIAMAQSLRLAVIAEGVETREQLDFLAAHGCHEMQGYYFHKPMPGEQARALLVAARAKVARQA